MRLNWLATLLAIALTSPAALARVATGSGGSHFQTRMFDGQKRAQKEATQWTLLDWLGQKNKMSLADQWLAMNRTASFFEMNAAGAHSKFTIKNTDALGVKTERESDSAVYHLDLYFSIFNLYGEYEKWSDHRESWGGAAGLRLFGTSSQTTAFLARYGWRKLTKLDTQEVWENLFVEGDLQLYFVRFFGVHGRYRKVMPAKSNLGNTLEGTRATGGAFIEFREFRIYGDYFQEPMEFKDANGVKTKEERSGYEVGLKLYF